MLFTVVLLLLPCVVCVCVPFRWLTSQEWPRLRRMLYFPIAGNERPEHRAQRQRLLIRHGGVEVKLRTPDDRDVHCVWIECRDPERGGGGRRASRDAIDGDDACATPVALCLHANAMVLDDMIDWAQFYTARGVSVLLVTFWGYPDPDEREPDEPPLGMESAADSPRELLVGDEGGAREVRCPTEFTMCHDAEVALHWIREARGVPIDRVLVHGLSIGGGVAASLGVQHPGLRVTFDQTFASIHEVSIHVGAGLYEQLLYPRAPRHCHSLVRCLQPVLLRLVAFVLLRMLFKTGRKSAQICAQDRFDNVRKARLIKGDVFAIFAEHDEMMPHSVSRRLLAARYGRHAPAELLRSRCLCVPGGHCAFFGDAPELAHKYTQYLLSCGFLAR